MSCIEIPDIDDVEFERRCPLCVGGQQTEYRWETVVGKRRKKRTEVQVPCRYCDGTGMVITPVGHRLLDFLARHGGKKE